MEKHQLRTLLKQRRANYSPEERTEASLSICQRLCHEAWWREAAIIHLYYSFGTEVETGSLVEEAFVAKKRVIVPIADPQSNALLHAEITPQTLFQTDAWGISVPSTQTSTRSTPHLMMSAQDCIIVPLLGFDAKLHRLGYGRGYYDRFLATFLAEETVKPHCIGLAFTTQYVEEELPREMHDVPLDMVITERGSCRGTNND